MFGVRARLSIGMNMPLEYPTADEAARIIIAAAREADCDAEAILIYRWSKARQVRLCRAYAAVALHRLFPECPRPAIARMVNMNDKPAYVSEILGRIERHRFPDFDGKALWRVQGAVGRKIARPKENAPAPRIRAAVGPLASDRPEREAETLPAFLPGCGRPASKLSLEDELRRAVENTARMSQH
jgi:hypothetical protein